jgi:hypothetical protein
MDAGVGNDMHFVGNDITNTNSLQGAYTITGTGHFQYGNRRKGANNVIPTGTTNLTRTSYYLCGEPEWWKLATYSWPNIGIPYTYNATEIPAETRWKGGLQEAWYHPSLRVNNKKEAQIWYQDADGDGFGNPNATTSACLQPTGYVSNNTDCNDKDKDINPNTIWFEDRDGDGYSTGNTLTGCEKPSGYVLSNLLNSNQIDCNDNDNTIYPGAEEVPNDGIDQDCDGNDLITTGIAEMQLINATLFPNPSDGNTLLQLDVRKSGEYGLIIMDVAGRHIQAERYQLSIGRLEIPINVKGSGLYIIHLTGNGHQTVLKMAVQ